MEYQAIRFRISYNSEYLGCAMVEYFLRGARAYVSRLLVTHDKYTTQNVYFASIHIRVAIKRRIHARTHAHTFGSLDSNESSVNEHLEGSSQEENHVDQNIQRNECSTMRVKEIQTVCNCLNCCGHTQTGD